MVHSLGFTLLIIAALGLLAKVAGKKNRYGSSEVEFGDCKELALGTVVPLASLQAMVPSNVKVLSLAEQGFDFEGSENLGNLLVRTLECEFIEVTFSAGKCRGPFKQHNRHLAHIGTPFDTSTFPNSPYSTDGGNGADFNNYIFAYLTDSKYFLRAMRRAGIKDAGYAYITMTDKTVGDCQVTRTAEVQPRGKLSGYAYTATTGTVPDATCSTPDTPYVANWWMARGLNALILSNLIPEQVALFTNATVDIDASSGKTLAGLYGKEKTTADSFALLGFLPEADDIVDMKIQLAGLIAAN